MKHYLTDLLLLAPVAICGGDTIGSLPNAAPGGAPGGKEGVEDDSCWKNSDGEHVKADVRGTTHGDVKVKVSVGDHCSYEKVGTPAADGGCWESEEMIVASKSYRCSGGKLQEKQNDGTWKTCKEDKSDSCAQDDEIEIY